LKPRPRFQSETLPPFEYSGRRRPLTERRSESYEKFRAETGIQLTNNCGIDCDIYKSDWHGVAPSVEIVIADFTTLASRTPTPARAYQFELAL